MKENPHKKSTAVCAVSVFLIILTLIAVISHFVSHCGVCCKIKPRRETQKADD